MFHYHPLNSNPDRYGRSIRIFLESDDPVGPSLRRLESSDCIVISFPRHALRRVSSWPEMNRRGIYVLVAPALGDCALRMYVGQAQSVAARIISHEKDRIDQRYVQTIVITSADDQMSEDTAKVLEQELIHSLRLTGLVEIDNQSLTSPRQRAGAYVSARRFLKDALMLMGPVEPMAGLVAATASCQERKRIFTKQSAAYKPATAGGEMTYELRRSDCHAFATKVCSRGMRILAGARIASNVHHTLPQPIIALRRRLIVDGSLVFSADPRVLVLIRDTETISATAAASIVTGRKTDGYHSWNSTKL